MMFAASRSEKDCYYDMRSNSSPPLHNLIEIIGILWFYLLSNKEIAFMILKKLIEFENIWMVKIL
jgi:hypothetical protein